MFPESFPGELQWPAPSLEEDCLALGRNTVCRGSGARGLSTLAALPFLPKGPKLPWVPHETAGKSQSLVVERRVPEGLASSRPPLDP